PSAGRFVDSAIAPSPAHLYFLVRPRSNAWLPTATPSTPTKTPNSPSKLPLILDRKGAMSAVPSGMPVTPITSPPAFLILSAQASRVDRPHAQSLEAM